MSSSVKSVIWNRDSIRFFGSGGFPPVPSEDGSGSGPLGPSGPRTPTSNPPGETDALAAEPSEVVVNAPARRILTRESCTLCPICRAW